MTLDPRNDSVPLAVSATPFQSPRTFVAELLEHASAGRSIDMCDAIRDCPDLRFDRSAFLDLAYEQYCAEVRAAGIVNVEDFCSRMPAFQRSVRRLLDIHGLLSSWSPVAFHDLQQPHWPVPGETLLGFDVVEELGRGAFARVFLAHERAFGGRQVVLKCTTHGSHEATILGQLDHPNIVTAHSIQHDDERALSVICMRYVGHHTLWDIIDRSFVDGRWSPEAASLAHVADEREPPTDGATVRVLSSRHKYFDDVAYLGAQLAAALAYAHSCGIIHRDIKPSNVILAADLHPVLIDFNLSWHSTAAPKHVAGTLGYMAPEILAALSSAHRSDIACGTENQADIYSAGSVLYELLTGELPYGTICPSQSIPLTMTSRKQQIERGLIPVRSINPAVPHELAVIVETCLRAKAVERFESARQLADELTRYTRPRAKARRAVRRHRGTFFGILGVLLTVIGSGLWLIASRPPFPERMFDKGCSSYRNGKLSDAIEFFDLAVLSNPEDIRFRFARGRTHQKLGAMEYARHDYFAVNRIAHHPRNLACIAYSLAELDKHQLASEYWMKAHDAGFQSAESWNNVGYSLMRIGQHEEAVACLDRALDLKPMLRPALYNRSNAYVQLYMRGLGHIDHALMDIERAITMGPPSGHLYLDGAVAFALASQTNKSYSRRALEFSKQAIAHGVPVASVLNDVTFTRLLLDDHLREELSRTPVKTTLQSAVRIVDPLDGFPDDLTLAPPQ